MVKENSDPKKLFSTNLIEVDENTTPVNICAYGNVMTQLNYMPTRLILGPAVSQRLINFLLNENTSK